MCNRVKLAKTAPKQPTFGKMCGLVLGTTRTSGRLDAVRDDEACVPSSVAP